MSDDYDKFVNACERMDDDGDTYLFTVQSGTNRMELNLQESVSAFQEIRIVLKKDGTYEVFTEMTEKQRLFKELRARWGAFHDWDDDDLTNLLDHLDVKY